MIFLPMLLPIAAGILLIFLKNISRNTRILLVSAAFALTAAAAAYTIFTCGEATVLSLGGGLEIYFRVDELSKLFAGLVVIINILCAVFAFEYMKHEENEGRFFGFYMIVIGVLLALAFAGNLITMYLCFEFATLTSVPLVLHSMKKEAISAALKYLFYSIAGAFMGLFGIFVVYSFSSGDKFSAEGFIDTAKYAENGGLLLVGVFFMIIGFGAKAGMFPLHAWLSAAHPQAPAPASAVLSGIIAKAGIFAVVRVVYYSVGAKILAGTWVQYTWLVLALITVFMGSMMAFREKQIKKRLAYSSVSQLSYIMLGLAMLTPDAFSGALFHVVFHAVIKSGLFLAAGAIIYKTGITNVDELRGIGKKMPVTIWCWTFFSLALVGIPPFCGFFSKWFLAVGSLSSGTGVFEWLAPAVLLVSALLTAGYLFPVTIKGFFPGNDFDYKTLEKTEASPVMTVPLILLAAAALLLGVFTTPLSGYIGEIVGRLM